ncbi:MAG: helix-turn-helix transcriptional regulator [Actinobacteria bacterium]|nr:helix-turn-helix transcriptional regulator [Actinomycetota bacterium]
MNQVPDVLNPACDSRTVLRHLTDRWAPLIVLALVPNALRFGELRARIGTITPKVLTETLRSMERDGLVVRTVTPSSPPRVDYELSELGRTLTTPVETLREWAESNVEAVLANRARYDCGHAATRGRTLLRT